MKTRRPVLIAAAATAAVATSTWLYSKSRQRASLPVFRYVDLKRYSGLWYEVARLPTRFEKGCEHVTAEYTLRPDGKVDVVNTCHAGSIDGPEEKAKGLARVADCQTNAKLKVSFFWPFEGDYWILDLDEIDYRYALVGEPRRENLWILSRTPQLLRSTRNRLIAKAQELGFPVNNLIFTLQPVADKP